MALYAFDGTWKSDKSGEEDHTDTNVVRFFDAYAARSGTGDLYTPGIGTRLKALGKILGGFLGAGELPRLKEAYKKLCENWDADDDHIIDIVGFSRGAATSLDFCHMIQERGIRRPGSDEIVEAAPIIRFVGLWDVVPAFGLGCFGNTALNFGHRLTLPTTGVTYCFHALALDEQRLSFLPIRLHGGYEVWFRGVHSDVGGGNDNEGLEDISLKWMMSKARAAGLPIAAADIQALQPNAASIPKPQFRLVDIRNISAVDRRHYTAEDINGWRCAPGTCLIETEADEAMATPVGADGFSLLPDETRRRILVLWETAVERARQKYGVDLDAVQESLLGLIHGRISLVTDDETLRRARIGTVTLIDVMMQQARQMGWTRPSEFFLNFVLSNRRHLFPFTD